MIVPSAILLHPTDNVICLLRDHLAGEKPLVASIQSEIQEGPALIANVPLGHKVAFATIPTSAKVIKYGARIGQATQDINAGEHVHLHNLEDRTPHGYGSC
jgi:altronate dehydratase